jgi:ArsR family transcriptional regulator
VIDDLKKYETIAEKLKTLAHPQRLCIVKGLIDNECNVTKIQECLGLPQSTVSQHIAKLRTAGIIKGKRDGVEICYSVVDKDIVELVNLLFKA